MSFRQQSTKTPNPEFEGHEVNLEEREKRIRELSIKYNMSGFDHTPLEREKVVEFISRLSELQSRQNAETDRVTVCPYSIWLLLQCDAETPV